MARLDALDLTLRLSAEDEARRLQAAQRSLLQLRLLAGGLIGGLGWAGLNGVGLAPNPRQPKGARGSTS